MFLPIDITHFVLFIAANATNALTNSSGATAVPVSAESTLGIGGIVTAIAGIAGKSFLDKRKDDNVQSWGSETDKILLNDIQDNFKVLCDFLEIEKMIQDYSQSEAYKGASYFSLLDIVVDVSTKETLGQRRARFINEVLDDYERYYNTTTPNITCPNPNNPVARTLTNVKEHTTAS